MSSLDRILRPRSVAVLGASQNPAKRGNQVVRSLVMGGYTGRVVPVHPSGGVLHGLDVVADVAAIDPPVDAAYVALGAELVPDAVRACGEAGMAGAIVPAVGFRESGRHGAAIEKRLGQAAAATGIRVVGPNTSGVINSAIGMNLVGMRDVPAGRLALLAQSGNVALDVINGLARAGLGLSVYAGVGNELDIGFDEYLAFLAEDETTESIMIYAEGFRDGRRFLDMAREVCRAKPVVLLKGGRSDLGAAAARSHTGAIAGSYSVLRAALRQIGVTEVQRSDELIPVAHTLAGQPAVPGGNGVAILSDGGGHGTLMSDALAELSVPLPKMSQHTRRRMRSVLGPAANVMNPVDLAGAADHDPGVFVSAADLILRDRGTGGLMIVGLFGGYAVRFDETLADGELEAARGLVQRAAEHKCPLIVHTLYADWNTPPLRYLRDHGVPVVGSIEVAARCMAALRTRVTLLERDSVPPLGPVARENTPSVLTGARQERRTTLMESEVRELLEACGVQVSPFAVSRTAAEAVKTAATFGTPVALKILSPDISHKTEAGGVRLGVSGRRAVAASFDGIISGCTAFAQAQGFGPDLRGVLVTPMLPAPVAELIVGVRRDAQYGLVLTVGAGGVAVEVHRDTALRVLPIGIGEVAEMLRETRVGQVLDGYRGGPPADMAAVTAAVHGVVRCAVKHPEIQVIEANPLFVYPDRAVVVDARAFVFSGSGRGSGRTAVPSR